MADPPLLTRFIVQASRAPVGVQPKVVAYVAWARVKAPVGASISLQGIVPAMVPVMVPLQERLPLLLVTVQPVPPYPPARLTSPVAVPFKFNASAPLLSIEKAISVSPPVAVNRTVPAVAALVRVASFTAEAVVPNLIDSLPLLSKISPPVTWRSSAITVLVPVLSIVKFPDESTVWAE